jgi:hypothetical protein
MQTVSHIVIILFLLAGQALPAQVAFSYNDLKGGQGADILFSGADGIVSARSCLPGTPDSMYVVYCPAGITRSSANDVRRRRPFEWRAKYNSVYLEVKGGLVVEGMNERGFSASLLFLENSLLPGREKEHIPLAASLWTRFFLDHFGTVDTALLAVWDTRVFNDSGHAGEWPFRLILHDSSGATACIEYINGSRHVYTPEAPAVIIDGPAFSRLIGMVHLENIHPESPAEQRYLTARDILRKHSEPAGMQAAGDILKHLHENNNHGNLILRNHEKAELLIISETGKERLIRPGGVKSSTKKEIREKLFTE